jgi:hypothetical protein
MICESYLIRRINRQVTHCALTEDKLFGSDPRDRSRNSSGITLNSAPTLLSKVEYVCLKVCDPMHFCGKTT